MSSPAPSPGAEPPAAVRPAIPADFLPYAAPLQRGRPGLVTAIGVVSIVVASLSLLYSLQQTVGAAVMMMVSRMSARMSAVGATTTTTVTSSGTTVTMTTSTTAPGPTTATASGTSGASSTGGTSTGAKPPFAPQMADAACIAVAAEGVLSLGLAALLMVAGILTLRQSPKARRLHAIWAWSKIPLTLVGAAAYGWMMADFRPPPRARRPPSAGPCSSCYMRGSSWRWAAATRSGF